MHLAITYNDSIILFDIVRVINHLYVCMYVSNGTTFNDLE